MIRTTNRVNNMTNKNYVCTIVAILSIGVLLTYFYQFHVGLSNRQSDWSDFATFFASTLSPVLALINIVVFIDLTKSIERNRQMNEDAKNNEQEKRHEREIEHQKAMQLFRLRVDTIQRLDSVLEKTFSPIINECQNGIPTTLLSTVSELESFLKNKMDIFDFSTKEEKELFMRKIIECHKSLTSLSIRMKDQSYKVEKNDIVPFLDFKTQLIKNLYALILERKFEW